MIPFDFAYYAPETPEEAYACYASLLNEGKRPVWYAGGTELISMARAHSRTFGAVVDLKGIPECTRLEAAHGRLRLGAALTLTRIDQSGLFPLLGRTAARIADHTIQGKITLGGNLAGTIQYREAALPLLLCGGKALVMTARGAEERPFSRVFDGRLTLNEGEFLISLDLPAGAAELPYRHAKRTKLDKIDYPLVTLCAVRDRGILRAAVSGYAAAPLLLPTEILSNALLSAEERGERACTQVSGQSTESLSGSRAYKDFVLKDMVAQAVSELEGTS